ncbi:hypothetical protein ACFX1S_043847 [Malus domestica]
MSSDLNLNYGGKLATLSQLILFFSPFLQKPPFILVFCVGFLFNFDFPFRTMIISQGAENLSNNAGRLPINKIRDPNLNHAEFSDLPVEDKTRRNALPIGAIHLSTFQLHFPETIKDSIGSQPSASSTDLLHSTTSAFVSLSLLSAIWFYIQKKNIGYSHVGLSYETAVPGHHWRIITSAFSHITMKAVSKLVKNDSSVHQVVMSFHDCGGNVGDDVHIPLPHWVTEIGQKNPDIYFTNKEGKHNTEFLTWGIDKGRVLRGRTAVESKNGGLAACKPAGAAEWLENSSPPLWLSMNMFNVLHLQFRLIVLFKKL